MNKNWMGIIFAIAGIVYYSHEPLEVAEEVHILVTIVFMGFGALLMKE